MANTVSKNKTANTGKYSYKYVDIAQIHEYLESIGAQYYQYIDRLDGDDYVMTVRIINGEEKPPLRGARVVDAKLNGVVNPAQEQGSALTYARRYSLLLAFGLATDDDDAQSLSKPVAQKPKDPITKSDGTMSPLQKVRLQELMSDEEWDQAIARNGDPKTWKSEDAEKWISALERRKDA